MILPDQAARDIEPHWFEEGGNIRVADAFVVDIMLNANGQTYETLRKYSQCWTSMEFPCVQSAWKGCY